MTTVKKIIKIIYGYFIVKLVAIGWLKCEKSLAVNNQIKYSHKSVCLM